MEAQCQTVGAGLPGYSRYPQEFDPPEAKGDGGCPLHGGAGVPW